MMPPSDKLGVLKAQWEKEEEEEEREGGGARTAATASIYANMLKHPRLHFKELFTFFFFFLCRDSANLPTARSCTFDLFIYLFYNPGGCS